MTRKFNIVSLKTRRRQLRLASTSAEKVLWAEIRNKKLGVKFLRQYSVEGYVLDFYCPKAKVGIEIEGSIHELKDIKIYDSYRKRYLKEFNINILTFTNDQVLNSLYTVIHQIKVSLSLPKRGMKG